jgi:hypothetical protein
MSRDASQILDALFDGADHLDALSKQVDDYTDRLEDAEKLWDAAYDATMASLEEEYAEAGRKSVPEHTCLSAARRRYPQEYQGYRKAKRDVERLQIKLKAVQGALSGRQSGMGALREELRAMGVPVPQRGRS